MASDDGPVAHRLDELAARLESVERRLSQLEEAGGVEAIREVATAPAELGTPPVPAEAHESQRPLVGAGTVPLIGRTLLVLGGAFLLRAITEADLVPHALGSTLGLVYAIAWLVLADRVAGTRDRASDATFHGMATALIAFPLLWETTLQFEIIPPPISAGVLLVIAVAGIGVAWRRRIPGLAWMVGGGAVPTAIALGFASHSLTVFMACLLAIGVAVLWLSHALGTKVLAGLVGGAVHLVFFFLAVALLLEPDAGLLGGLTGPTLVALLGGLVVAYFGSTALRTLVDSKEVGWLELAELIVTFVVGIVGGVLVALVRGLPQPVVASVVLGLAAAFYAAAFARVEGRQGRGRTFLLYTTSALVLTIGGLPLLVGTEPAAMALSVLGAAAVWLGAQRGRMTPSVHGAVLVLAGAAASGLPARVIDGLVGAPGVPADWMSPPVIVALVAAAAASAVPSTGRAPDNPFVRASGALVALVLVLSLSALLSTVGAGWLPAGEAQAGALATLRTGVLAVTAVALVGAGRVRWSDLRWVAYSVVVVGAVKLLLEDLRVGQAATLFISLALYGGALILVSRLARTGSGEEATPAPKRDEEPSPSSPEPSGTPETPTD